MYPFFIHFSKYLKQIGVSYRVLKKREFSINLIFLILTPLVIFEKSRGGSVSFFSHSNFGVGMNKRCYLYLSK